MKEKMLLLIRNLRIIWKAEQNSETHLKTAAEPEEHLEVVILILLPEAS